MLASFVLLAQDSTVTTTNSPVPSGVFAHNIIYTLLIGFVVGVIAKLITPGRDAAGCIVTSLIGIAGAFLAYFVGASFGHYGNGVGPGIIASTIGAVVVLVIYHAIFKRGGGTGPTM